MRNDDEYDDYEEDRGWLGNVAAIGALVLVPSAVLWFGVVANGGGGESDQVTIANTASQPLETVGSTEASSLPPIEPVEAPSTTTNRSRPTPGSSTPTATPPPSVVPPLAPASYQTLPDGSAVPVLALFGSELITLSGVVPSQAAIERLRVLALAYNATSGAQVASFLTVDPTVPVGVGVRVIETDSARFDEGSPTVSREYVAQLDRIVAMMTSLPNVTVDVIGHTDQSGDSEANSELSAGRARATADYLTSRGVDPTRLSSRGAGDSDLLTLNNDEAALALNRRTEFVFFGLLVDAAEPT